MIKSLFSQEFYGVYIYLYKGLTTSILNFSWARIWECLFCLSQTLGQHILSLWHFLSWTPVFLESLGLSPGGIFFVVAQFWFLGPAGTGNLFGTKIWGERSVCPMVTKLSGFGQYLGRNLMKVENLDFGHGIVLFWYWKPFWDQTLGQHILSLWHFLSWTLVFLESLGLSPGRIFFYSPILIFGPCRYWKPFWDQNLRREILLSNSDQTFSIWSVSR